LATKKMPGLRAKDARTVQVTTPRAAPGKQSGKGAPHKTQRVKRVIKKSVDAPVDDVEELTLLERTFRKLLAGVKARAKLRQ